MRALGATILKQPNSAHPVSLRRLHLWRMSKMVAPRALIFQPLVKGNKDSGNEIETLQKPFEGKDFDPQYIQIPVSIIATVYFCKKKKERKKEKKHL